jgi:hypothetical protein
MVSPLKFFLDAEGGSLAFLKEKDYADFVVSDFRTASGVEAYGALPAKDAAGTLLVKDVRNALIAFVPVDPAAVYSFVVYSQTETQQAEMQVWKVMDGGVYTDRSGPLEIGVDVFGPSSITVLVTALSVGNLHIEMAQIPYDLEP